ncbi:MAG: beta-ketoacyl-[acyl-carrier-protein] synthase family protein [Gammaproteobacteria bacterium]|nr:beta-ketoacyl-[acyl-carrier-protein] synthase family protein [Gammaproteobacteria bacterium]
MNPPRIVITGLGAVTGFGFEWQGLWSDMLRGRHCIRPWQPEGVSEGSFPVRYAAPVDWQRLPAYLRSHPALAGELERRTRFGWLAASQALADSRLGYAHWRDVAVLAASGAPQHSLDDMQLAFADGETAPSWKSVMRHAASVRGDASLRQSSDRLARVIADELGSAGPVMNASSACAGAAQAIGNAFHMLRRGECELALAGGADSVLNLDTLGALYLLGAASTETRRGEALCRPFDAGRSGLVAGEGGGFLMLETLEHALARGAKPYAEILGYGSSLDGYRLTAPEPEGRGASEAMAAALDDAGIAPERVDLVNAHGTSTPLNDRAETLAIKRVFARDQHYRQLSVAANKSQFGHLIAAAGAPELLVSALCCREDWVTPTLNLDEPDPDCDLDYTAHKARHRRVDIALSNSFGFGGLNTALVLGKYRSDAS